ncbi:MAG: hypothetical protein Tsb0021_12800 [Chlamydiales bacterium]
MLSRLMQQLQEEMEIKESLQNPENPKMYSIPIEENVKANLHEDRNSIFLECDIGEAPQKEDFFAEALEANLLTEGTFGSVLGLDAAGKHLILSRMINQDIPYQRFKEVLEDYMNIVDFWKEKMTEKY